MREPESLVNEEPGQSGRLAGGVTTQQIYCNKVHMGRESQTPTRTDEQRQRG
jgi:hypothetical protein